MKILRCIQSKLYMITIKKYIMKHQLKFRRKMYALYYILPAQQAIRKALCLPIKTFTAVTSFAHQIRRRLALMQEILFADRCIQYSALALFSPAFMPAQ